MIKAVIFDMDGVIIDSELEYLKMDLEFAKAKNPSVTLEDLFGRVGSSKQDSWECMAKAINNGQTWEELREEYKNSIDVYANMDYRKIFRSEIVRILKYIKSKNLKIALASSTQMPIIQRVLSENEIIQYFEVVVSGSQFERSKPDPEIYHYTADKLGVSESECLVVEDSTFGVTAAHRAGMIVAALMDPRFHFDQSLADYRMKDLIEVAGIIGLSLG